MLSGRFIEQMGTCEGRKIATNMGVLLQERYRVTGLLITAANPIGGSTGVGFLRKGGIFRIVNVNVSFLARLLI